MERAAKDPELPPSDAPLADLPASDAWARAAAAGSEAAREESADAPGAAPIAAELLQQLIDAARAGFPNEACGIVAGAGSAAGGGLPTRFHPLRNAADSPYRYLIDPDEQLRVMLAIEDADEVVWGIFHSHVASPAEPSDTDVGLALYPDSLYLICSLAGTLPDVRAWWIRDGAVSEVPLQVR